MEPGAGGLQSSTLTLDCPDLTIGAGLALLTHIHKEARDLWKPNVIYQDIFLASRLTVVTVQILLSYAVHYMILFYF